MPRLPSHHAHARGIRALRAAANGWPPAAASTSCCKEFSMLDIIVLALGFGFFALSIGYAYACDRL
ncbi:hypothetical protein JQ557_32485 [Bradyrhizobium sp. U87765 SZCCT0131]|uniref:hypothetical protein n=1 Tax=unclassified Bradyrhizobium TaxID=2631580 RepID=UPI001BA98328|nr:MULTISPECIES: hypothetical protein [unclassified Bradyrhizobium]MBR1222758.1 hypothetical protein [Bradyrhizobium sp. U87765 SZCCT0131]MBR1265161.1 hypothetical protein [Bradyrhizobium sp. U87765 SZCCT0134]MBR1303060.1 hypothetical protein [Bradyrhizobium sp. U87765 SZCCT0110]MBR1318666.1 hypothetical protein [Bradyrhizobium sp. U87765 SZCCT0109]MBR1346989.1 hypothetical protein [Bradyrhizobium sp. U87765 SZCCT0048]